MKTKICSAVIALVLANVAVAAGALERPVLAGFCEDAAKVSAGNFTPELQRRFYAAAVETAIRKMREGEEKIRNHPPAREILPRISTGGGFDGLFLWDTCFCVMSI